MATNTDKIKSNFKPLHNITMEDINQQITQLRLSLQDIREALLGNDFNKDGLVGVVQDHEARLKTLESQERTMKVYENIMKFIAGVITTGVLGFLLSLLLKK